MTKGFHAKYLERKLRKKLIVFCLTLIFLATIIGLILSFFVNEFVALIFVMFFVLIWRLWAYKKISYNVYQKPIYDIFEQNLDIELFKSVYEQSFICDPFDYRMILLAFFEADYQKAINICAYNIKNSKNKKLVCVSMIFLMHAYYDLQDIENLKKAKADYEIFLLKHPQMPKSFLEFVENYLNGNFDYCKKYLSNLSEKETLAIGKIRAKFRLGYISYKTGDYEEAKSLFMYVSENAPNLYQGKISQQYIQVIDNNGEKFFDHTVEFAKIVPQEDFQIKKIAKSKTTNLISTILFTTAFIVALAVLIYNIFFRTYLDYTFAPETVEALYGYTIDELLENDLDLYNDIGDIRNNAEIDSNGNLVVKYTMFQSLFLKNSDWITDFKLLETITNTDVSDDYKSILIYITPEMKRYTEEEWISYENRISSVFLKIQMYQILNRVPEDKQTISFKIIDQDDGTILHKDTWNSRHSLPNFSALYHEFYYVYGWNVNCLLRNNYGDSAVTIAQMNIYSGNDYIETVFLIDNNGELSLVSIIHDDHGMPCDVVTIQENVQKNENYDIISPTSNCEFGFHIFKDQKYEEHNCHKFVSFKIRTTHYRFCVDYINQPTK